MFDFFQNTLSGWQWGLLGLVPPAIVALYFLKLRRQPLEVPSTYLWKRSIEDMHVNSLWQRLRQNLLLFLQLLLIALAMLALMRPGWEGTKLQGDRFIFLVDNSASMSSTDEKITKNRLEEAKKVVGGMIDQMSSGYFASDWRRSNPLCAEPIYTVRSNWLMGWRTRTECRCGKAIGTSTLS